MLLKKYKINENLNYFNYTTKKYKSFAIKIYFFLPFDKEKITIRNLLKDIMMFDCSKYSSTELENKKKELYNLKISFNSIPLNKYHQFILTVSGTNPKFFMDEDYTIDKVFEFINEIIFRPSVKDNKFDEYNYDLWFNRYKTALKTALEDKNFIAGNESVEILDDDINKFNQFGYLKDFDSITNEDLYNEYCNLINSKIIIASGGDLDKQTLKRNIKKYFYSFEEFKEKVEMTPTKYQKEKKKVIEVKTEQAIIALNFATEVKKFDQDYFNYLIFNLLFGGDASSKLFQTVREEYGFCYEIYSGVEVISGLISVFLGLDEKNIDKAIELILEQVEEIKKGNFSKSLLKELINNEYLKTQSVYDSLQSTLNREISLYLDNRDSSLKVLKEDLKKVTKEEVQQFASRVKLIGTVIIKSKGEVNNANN